MPASLFVRTEVKKRERRRKGENSFVPGCIFLRLWFPSTANVNKQSHERGKHGQSGGGEKDGGGRGGGGRKQSASKKYLGRLCEIQVTSSFTGITARQKHTHSQATQIWLADTPAHRGASVSPVTNSWHTSISTCWTTAANKAAASPRIKWCDDSKPQGRDLPEGPRLHFRGVEISVDLAWISLSAEDLSQREASRP